MELAAVDKTHSAALSPIQLLTLNVGVTVYTFFFPCGDVIFFSFCGTFTVCTPTPSLSE